MKKITINIQVPQNKEKNAPLVFRTKEEVMQEFSNHYDVAVAEETVDAERIKAAVLELYAKNKGAQFRGRYLESQIMLAVGATGATFPMLSKRLETFIKENKGERGSALFGMQMGRNPGLFLWADRPEGETES